ncbi:MAG: secretin N-terminal domain-containing protein [Candidatus Omnitrophota bacterium]
MSNNFKVFMFFLVFCLLPLKLPAQDQSSIFDPEVTVSMDMQDANLKDVVKILSVQSGLNFIASESVQDRVITLYLDNVPIKDAMDKIFSANNLTYDLDKKAKIFIVKDWGKPEIERITKVFYLKHSTVSSSSLKSEMSSNLSSSATTTTGTTGTTETTGTTTEESGGKWATEDKAGITEAVKQNLSEYGILIEDYRTNSFIITDIPSRMPIIERIIASLDIPIPQVLLEVEILDVNKNTVDKLGFDFGNNPVSLLIGRAGGKGNKIRGFLGNVLDKAPQTFDPTSTGVVAMGGTFAETLDFLRTRTDTKFLARPRLLTLNNETAEISITKDEVVGRKETNNTGSTGDILATNVEYVRSTALELTKGGTGIFLRVTPQINPDTNEITMVINPKSSVTTASAISSTDNPQSDAEVRSTKSIVKVHDGETVILSGLIHNEKQVIIKKVPILGDIPFLGVLFRHKDKTKDIERELVVFITPHIVKDEHTEQTPYGQAQKTALLAKEQIAIAPPDRKLAIEASLNSFEKIK